MYPTKSKTLYFDVGGLASRAMLVTRTSEGCSVTAYHELPFGDELVLANLGPHFHPKKGMTFISGDVVFWPASRILRHATPDPSVSRAKDPDFIPNLFQIVANVSPADYRILAFNAADGAPFSPEKSLTHQKELAIAAVRKAEILDFQKEIEAKGLVPDSLEVATFATICALKAHQAAKQDNSPILILELGLNSSWAHILSNGGLAQSKELTFGVEQIFPIVAQELGLKDADSAKKLMLSSSFDFSEMGASLVGKLQKEIQMVGGSFELHTGLSLKGLFVPGLPKSLSWLPAIISKRSAIPLLAVDKDFILGLLKLKVADEEAGRTPVESLFPLLGLAGNFNK